MMIFTFGLVACDGSNKDSSTANKGVTPPVSEPDKFSPLRNTVKLELAENKAVAVSIAIVQLELLVVLTSSS